MFERITEEMKWRTHVWEMMTKHNQGQWDRHSALTVEAFEEF